MGIMTQYLICLDAVFEHDPDRLLIRRMAGHPTPKTAGEWRAYAELGAGTGVNRYPTLRTDQPAGPGRRLMIRWDGEEWAYATDVTSLILDTDRLPSGRWRPSEAGDPTVDGPDGIRILLPRIHPTSTVGIAAILDVAEAMPIPEDIDVRAEWYWPVAPYGYGWWKVCDRTTGEALIGPTTKAIARTVSLLLARHPIRTYAHIFSALMGASEWDVQDPDRFAYDDRVAVLLEQAGWSVDHLAAIGPQARWQLLGEARAIEWAGTPWPLVQEAWRPSA